MNYRNSSAYVQKMINKILYSFRYFYRTYVNNIVVFSTSLKKHLRYLNFIFQALFNMNIHLIPIKAFFRYFFIQLLSQHIDVLNLIIFEDKLTIIRNFEFSHILTILKHYLELINYFKQYVSYYNIIAMPLQKRKIFLNRNCKSIMRNVRKFEIDKTYL